MASRAYFDAASCADYGWVMKIEAIYSSETSVDFQRITWLYTREYRTLISYHNVTYILC
jgi:hypothetical protein